MAEAFGIATGVLQVAGFGAALGGTLFKCAKEMRNANKELETIATQVEVTSKSLDAVGALLGDPDTKDVHTPKLYEDTNAVAKGCHEVFCELRTAVDAFENKSGKFKLTVIARLQWPLSSARLLDLQKVLKNYGDVLHLMLAVLQIVEGRRAATKEELHGLETHLRSLVISNNSLTEANKSLSDTIAAITQRPCDFQNTATVNLVSSPTNPTTSVSHDEGRSRTLTASPERTGDSRQSADHVLEVSPGDHLLRCMQAVQELASSISYAMDAWQGQPKPGNSDVHSSFANVTACFDELPRMLECTVCKRRVIWPRFNSDGAQGSRSTCACLTSPSSVAWRPIKRLKRRWFAQNSGTMNQIANEISNETMTTLFRPREYAYHKATKQPGDDILLLPPPSPPRQQVASSFSQDTSTTGTLPDLVPYPGAREPDTHVSATYIPSGSSYGPDIGLPRAETNLPLQVLDPPEAASRFCVSTNPPAKKEKNEMRENRKHVMRDYLRKEARKTSDPRDVRARGLQSDRRRRLDSSTTEGPNSLNPAAPMPIIGPGVEEKRPHLGDVSTAPERKRCWSLDTACRSNIRDRHKFAQASDERYEDDCLYKSSAVRRHRTWSHCARSRSGPWSCSASRASSSESRGDCERHRSRSRDRSGGRQSDHIVDDASVFTKDFVGTGLMSDYLLKQSRRQRSPEKLCPNKRFIDSSEDTESPSKVAKTDRTEGTEETSAIQSLFSRWVEKDARSIILSSENM